MLKHIRQIRTKRGGGVYTYFNTGQRDEAGKPVLLRLPDPSDRAFPAAYAAACANRTRREHLEPGEITFNQLVDLFEKSPHFRSTLAPGSRAIYRRNLERLASLYGKAPAAALSQQTIRRMMDENAHRTGVANGFLGAIGALYSWALKRGHVKINPATGVESFSSEPIPAWPQAALDAALACDDPRVRVATALLYYTGQRVSDVINMRWSDVATGSITLSQQKTGKPLTIPVHRDLAAILAESPREGLYIITMRDGVRQATRTAVREWLMRWCAPRGWQVTTHGLRKNAVNALIECGCSTGEVSSITGQSLAMVEHYARERNQVKMAGAAVLKWERK